MIPRPSPSEAEKLGWLKYLMAMILSLITLGIISGVCGLPVYHVSNFMIIGGIWAFAMLFKWKEELRKEHEEKEYRDNAYKHIGTADDIRKSIMREKLDKINSMLPKKYRKEPKE